MLTDGLAAYGSPTDFTEYRCSIRGCSSLRCTNRALVHQHCNPSTEFTEFTEASGVEEPPTDFTDAHRWLGCVRFCGFCGKIVWWLRGYGIPAIPTQPSANPPTEFTEFTEVSGARYSPTDFTDAHRLGGYGIPAIPTPPSANPPTEFTEFTEVSGVEEPPTDFTDAHRWLGCVRFCGFCGKIV